MAKASKDGILGTIVTWRVPTEVTFETLQKGLRDANLDEDLVKELAPYHALCRALGDMKKGRVIRKLRHEGSKIFFQLTAENVGETEVTYDKEAELSIETKTGELECDRKAIKDKAAQLLAEHQSKRRASDLASLMFRIYKKYSGDLIAIREQGGAYFVPKAHSGLVDKTRVLFGTIGGNLRSFDVRLGSDDTSESVAESMTDYFQQQVKQFRDACEKMDGKVRGDVAERKTQQIAEMRQKLELYRGLLRGYADTIDSEIAEANEELLKKLAVGAE